MSFSHNEVNTNIRYIPCLSFHRLHSEDKCLLIMQLLRWRRYTVSSKWPDPRFLTTKWNRPSSRTRKEDFVNLAKYLILCMSAGVSLTKVPGLIFSWIFYWNSSSFSQVFFFEYWKTLRWPLNFSQRSTPFLIKGNLFVVKCQIQLINYFWLCKLHWKQGLLMVGHPILSLLILPRSTYIGAAYSFVCIMD